MQGEFVWGSNYTFLINVEHLGEGLQAVYKPTRGERPLWDFPKASLAKREVAAYLVSQALEWGMINRVVPESQLMDNVANIAAGLAAGPVGAYGLTKRLFNTSVLPNLEEVLQFEGELQEIASKGKEHEQGMEAFLSKREK